MNIDVKYWLYNYLGKAFDKKNLLKPNFNYKTHFEIDKKPSANCIKIRPKTACKVIHIHQKKNTAFSIPNILNNNAIRFVLVSVFVVAILSMPNMPFSNAEKFTTNYVDIQVRSGDTVWTIASQYASNKEDLRELVYAIRAMNGLNDNALIYTGQILKVPTVSNPNMNALHNLPR